MTSAPPLLLLLACAAFAGFLATRVRLPMITGALVAGFVLGPAMGVVTPAMTSSILAPLATATLAWIALAAGARMTAAVVKETGKSAAISTVAQLVVCAPMLALVFWATAPVELMPFAALCGVVATTRSPIITVAVLRETKADGPLARHLLSVVVLQSAATMPLFFALLLWMRADTGGAPLDVVDVVKVSGSLALIAIGFVIANAHARVSTTIEQMGRVAPLLLVAFFAVAGASVDVAALRVWWPLALLLSVVRAALTFCACRLGHRLAGDPDVVVRHAWIGLLPQAGVTAALASLVATTLPGYGAQAFATLAMAVVFVDEIVGAPLLRLALARAGETRTSS